MIDYENSNINVIKYKIEKFEEVDEVSYKMMNVNPLVGVIPLGRQDDYFLIPISKYKKLDDYLKEEVSSVDDALKITEQLDGILNLLSEYMVPLEELVLDFDYAFIDEGVLILPVIPTSHSYLNSHTRREFFVSVLMAPMYSSDEERLKAIKTIQGERALAKPQKKQKREKNKKEKTLKKENKIKEKIRKSIFSKSKDDIFEFEKDDTLPNDMCVIHVRGTGEEFPLMFGPDTIGRDKMRCSICFENNSLLEMEHAVISLVRGKYYIADLNSKNGTMLNGDPLEPGKTYELSFADLINVGGEELVFSHRN